MVTKEIFGPDSAIHIEILLPAFVLGMMMKTKEHHTKADETASSVISYMFMFLVGMSAPLFVGVDFSATAGDCVIGQVGDMSWGEIAGIVFIALGYGLGGPLLAISLLTILTNLILTGFIVMIVKALAMKADRQAKTA